MSRFQASATSIALSPPWPTSARVALTSAFVLSGAAGLMYESAWTRYLGLFVGHGAYAQVIVLVIFMGGMAAGALAVARRSERLADPLRLYAAVEVLVGLLGLAFHPAFVSLTGLAYDAWFPRLGETPALAAVKWGLAGLLILPQSVLLGTTFPLMSAGAVRRERREPGRVVARLYFANSLGAAVGVLVAGFWLAKAVGLPGTLAVAAGLNLAVAALVMALARRRPARQDDEARVPWRPPPAPDGASTGLAPLLIAVSFGTAVASFVYEIAWVRMLSLVLGSATHSFELMLSAFILGLALGSAWIQTRADRLRDPVRFLGWTQWLMGGLALATLPLYSASFAWMAGLVTHLRGAPGGYEAFSASRYGIGLAVMLPATFCAGITLPLLTRSLMAGASGESAIGAVYGANTLGSILGAVLAALVLLPWLGLERLLAAGAALDMALGVALLATAGRGGAGRRAAWALAAAGLAVTAGVGGWVRLDRMRLVSGVYRTGFLIPHAQSEVIYYHDGRTATVSVRRQPDGSLTLSTNGKPDASLPARWLAPNASRPPAPLQDDESTQVLLGVMALAHAPQARRAAVVGIGSGMTSHVLLGSPRLSRVLTIEIEPDMIEAARAFRPANRRTFDDPRSSFVVDDARSYFAASQERFDLIVSEPSHPWVSGVSGLFTDEFYARVSRSLTDEGVLGQWLHLYDLEDDLVLSVLTALQRHFRAFQVFMVSSTDVLIVATHRARGLSPQWDVLNDPGIAEDLKHTEPISGTLLDATWVTDGETLAPLLAGLPANSDFRPVLDLGAERARFRQSIAPGLILLHSDRFGVGAARAPRVGPLDTDDPPLPRVLRVRGLMWGTRVRAVLSGERALSSFPPEARPRLVESVRRARQVRGPTETDQAPADWRAWLADAILVENDLHRGTTGYADESFFDLLRRTARGASAPAPVHHAIEWLHALERRDLQQASSLTDTLLAEQRAQRGWVAPELLLDAGASVKLALGDREGARRVVAAFAPASGAPARDLRMRLIRAHLTPAQARRD